MFRTQDADGSGVIELDEFEGEPPNTHHLEFDPQPSHATLTRNPHTQPSHATLTRNPHWHPAPP
eukprot:5820496-Prymnesium_polylepis.1